MRSTTDNGHLTITISSGDYDRLERIATAGLRSRRHADVAQFLAGELERAVVLPSAEMGDGVVRMYSDLVFRDDDSNEYRRVTLVYPGEEDIALGRISVLTPVGTALIGLSEKQSISWRTPAGSLRRLTVMKVRPPADPSAARFASEDTHVAERNAS